MLDESSRRRTKQLAYNKKHGITPQTVHKDRSEVLRGTVVAEERGAERQAPPMQPIEIPGMPEQLDDPLLKLLNDSEKRQLIEQTNTEMLEAAENMEFEKAAMLRDTITRIEGLLSDGTKA